MLRVKLPVSHPRFLLFTFPFAKWKMGPRADVHLSFESRPPHSLVTLVLTMESSPLSDVPSLQRILCGADSHVNKETNYWW